MIGRLFSQFNPDLTLNTLLEDLISSHGKTVIDPLEYQKQLSEHEIEKLAACLQKRKSKVMDQMSDIEYILTPLVEFPKVHLTLDEKQKTVKTELTEFAKERIEIEICSYDKAVTIEDFLTKIFDLKEYIKHNKNVIRGTSLESHFIKTLLQNDKDKKIKHASLEAVMIQSVLDKKYFLITECFMNPRQYMKMGLDYTVLYQRFSYLTQLEELINKTYNLKKIMAEEENSVTNTLYQTIVKPFFG